MPWGAVDGNGGATGGDIASDGSAVIVRRLSSFSPAATLWLRPPGMNLAEVFSMPGCNLVLPGERQGEAIAFAPASTGLSFYTLSEGSHQPLNLIKALAGDITHDGHVNIDDILAVISAWGPCATSCAADIDHNGVINIDDLLFVINHWS
jgi:hypothetical protein